MAINVNRIKKRKIAGVSTSMVDGFVASGLLSEDQVKLAMAEHKRTNEPVISVLIKRGFVSEDRMKEVLSRELGMELRTNIKYIDVCRDALNLFTMEELKHYKCIPLDLEDNRLAVGISDPSNIVVMDNIRERINEANKTWDVYFVLVNEAETFDKIDDAFQEGESVSIGDDKLEALIKAALAETASEVAGNTNLLPIQALVDHLIVLGYQWKASDIHINPTDSHLQIRYRLDGVLFPGPSFPLSLHQSIVSRIKVMAQLNISERRAPQDGKIIFQKEDEGANLDLRVSIIPVFYGENIVIRILQRKRLFQLGALGLSEEMLEKVENVAKLSHGIFLVTGPTGSGKSTTLYAVLQTINAIEKNVVTLEDPIEYQMPQIRQSQINPAVGYDFATGLRVFLRHDPDVILVGEIRDEETAKMAFHAAQTGHLVFSTLHTNTAVGALSRLSMMGIEPFQLGSTLKGVLAQRLIRLICPFCKKGYLSNDVENMWLKSSSSVTLSTGAGCHRCKNRGYSGRKGIFELFLPDSEIASMIVHGASEIEINTVARQHGMLSFYHDAKEKIVFGITDFAEIMRVLPDLDTT